jgi:hypothetical protein
VEKFYLEADIQLEKETDDLKKAVAAIIDLPSPEDKQPDLLYFSAIFVSTGTNLNNAHFLPSELVKAENTIVSKALDVEHKEEDIIGHIYDRAYIDTNNKKLNINELAAKESANLDKDYSDMHIVIAGVIYKNRFPSLAEEVADNGWRVSMECYYNGYDVKVGDVIMSQREAEIIGLAHDDKVFGKLAQIVKNGKEIAKDKIERVLRDICFSGCGIVKNPANPPSIILETADEKEKPVIDPKEIIVLDYDKIEQSNTNNNVTSDNIEDVNTVITDTNDDDASLDYKDTIGICVSYKRRVVAEEPQGPNTEVIHEDWCTLYDSNCTSFSRDTSDPDCLKNKVLDTARAYVKKLINKTKKNDRRNELVSNLEKVVQKANMD